ncbi:hypothetical protein OG21DRAFT_1516204 [Imleria badia]|nr:hypothetical protein OG21DRAFT_1516204 [Imleria badia]
MTSAALKYTLPPYGKGMLCLCELNASNTPTTPNAALPVTSSMIFAQVFNYTVPAYSVSALTAYIL